MNSARFFSIFANYIAADFTGQIAYKESLVKGTDVFICELKSIQRKAFQATPKILALGERCQIHLWK